ncbi:MAG: heavy metal translocating P-type ATPase [Phyllobacteriaceae bacterium]|nr:heavy metal translocating P-type ATPase [Phyllobacteriaceae bacterium]
MTQHLTFDVSGMTCAACSARVEKVLARQPGVEKANVNLALERADIEIGPGVEPAALAAAIEKAGYCATLRLADRRKQREADAAREAARAAEERWTLTRFVISAAFALPLVVANLPMMTGTGHALLPPAWQAALAAGVMVFSTSRFYREAWAAARTGGSNMATLVSLGATAAFGWSVWRAIAGQGHEHLFFEAAAVVPTLVMLGKWLEARAKRGASSALTALARLKPATAERLTDGVAENVDTELLLPGDIVMVRPGGKIPCDGIVSAGVSAVDESLLTGESLPVKRAPGDPVVTGSLNGDGALEIRVTRVGEDTTLARVIRLVETAQLGEAPVQRLADRVSAIFVPTIILLATLTFFGWWLWSGEIESALSPAIAVLVIACPCALGLATPTALVAGTGAAARAGILIRDVEALDRAQAIGAVAFDKTGTLTLGLPRVVATHAVDGDAEALMAFAAAVESASEHPLARAIVAAAVTGFAPAVGVRAVRGEGITGMAGDKRIAVGDAVLMAREGVPPAEVIAAALKLPEAATLAFVALDGRLAGAIALADAARPEAAEAVALLAARGLPAMMITGDNEKVAAAIGAELGIANICAGVKPAEKMATVKAFRQDTGKPVAFVGDGLNDGPALAAADLGIALSSGTEVAREAAAITLMRPDLRLVADALDIAARTRRTIVQNLGWAFLYNVIGIPLAAFGLLSPVFAGAAMAFSSVSVVTNSALLARWRPRRRVRK